MTTVRGRAYGNKGGLAFETRLEWTYDFRRCKRRTASQKARRSRSWS